MKRLIIIPFLFISIVLFSQKNAFNELISSQSMDQAAVSFTVTSCSDGKVIFSYNTETPLIPASTQKIISSAAALEMLGDDYKYETAIYYYGTISNSGKLKGDIIIKGTGDPTLGSEYFSAHYGDFISKWVEKIKNIGISEIQGSVIADDSYFDYQPVPSKWLWEDVGNYYGAGVYGISILDNTYKIHFKTDTEGAMPTITNIEPANFQINLANMLKSSGTSDEGYIYASPYGTMGWISGTIPANRMDFILKGSITDPPLLVAKMLTTALENAGVRVSNKPTTTRVSALPSNYTPSLITRTYSPTIDKIIYTLNHNSINMYAETFVKTLGKKFEEKGSYNNGISIIESFISKMGVKKEEVSIVDGSGLSMANSVSSNAIVKVLNYMKSSDYYSTFFESLPKPGSEGTLQNTFLLPELKENLVAKSGSMKNVKSYAGYLRAKSGSLLSFCIIVNNYNGSSTSLTEKIEKILDETYNNN